MWYAFWSVVHDLWLFTTGPMVSVGSVPVTTLTQLPAPITRLQLSNYPHLEPDNNVAVRQLESQPVFLTGPNNTLPTTLNVSPEPAVPEPLATENKVTLETAALFTEPVSLDVLATELPHTRLNEPSIMYVSAILGTVCLREPGGLFDAIITTLPFGTAVTVSGFSGRYAHVLKGTFTGWVMKDDITPHKQAVWPELVTWGMYGAEHPDTINIRALLHDEFGAGSLSLPLQAGEYILLRLLEEKRSILWPAGRPRLPGNWHGLLKGTIGIHSSITPKTDTIMEWQTDSDGGRLAYVEAVGLDGVITTSCVGLVMAGQYTKQVWGAGDWKELRPVFIEVS